jgi:hypothetical protein
MVAVTGGPSLFNGDVMKTKPTLAERIKAVEEEADAELDILAEQMRPSNIPGPSLRQMWLARAGGNVLEAYLSVMEKGL